MILHLSDHDRGLFPTSDTLAQTLTHVANGHAASRLLESEYPTIGLVVSLPQFARADWAGKTSINRVQWESDPEGATGTVIIVPLETSANCEWVIDDTSAGQSTGSVTISADGISGLLPPQAGEVPLAVVHDGVNVDRALRHIVELGSKAQFDLLYKLGPYSRSAIATASRRIYRDINDSAPDEGGDVIDRADAEQVLSRLMYGLDGETSSVVMRMITRVATTGAAIRTSTMKYMATAIWSAAESMVRSHIGDPPMGRQLRRIARELKTIDPHRVLETYRANHPKALISVNRVQAALTAGATIGTHSLELDQPRPDDNW
ncbi:hypothetical protein [Microbacterium maritypicum]|uniref:Uncharacterized protein n=1 Tax=Microbacterium maritypicum MF109 TaxID=1333857 RepID=T5KJD8_MICMQ|nr:hypothetical protein [Microbacterium liquefaciens]EQM74853.1 hypothetical protein L687_05180 [Microbacterium maritypicum MF109]